MKFFVKEEKRNLKKGMGCWMEAPPPKLKWYYKGHLVIHPLDFLPFLLAIRALLLFFSASKRIENYIWFTTE